ncbi:MAG: hypothetical protein A2289_17465 [Deltaproteobacteria bacterium RIFOXYA12_FULL_58_15]|nr:MAG: hypothetical protein A2289_17465 [Deltaproteobacteria bacterium RIFOXYA12_FULL_58_15]OGR13262.1 MAG: hypothetical protein A2341_16980 [Deltaproteobacteria bacterium RIFOXYB12_FULL_58_9]
MATQPLIARVKKDESTDSVSILSPAVGVIDAVPAAGVFISPLQPFLNIRILGRKHAVQLPHGVQGFVAERWVEDTHMPVDYGKPLMRLSSAKAHGNEARTEEVTGGTGADGEPGMLQVRAPSQGVFYRRAGPDSPAYVEEGSEVKTGAVLGLVEVMKCFNQITYGGPGLPERGTVAKILVEDSQEVEHDQVMFLIRAI